ncbi:hypothetical protein PF005_g1306 [Phytophthora fragariae]|uniref:Uncharacterized protein n=1 Tax=Phytophthora fragariae TaxID=53985 RepID=A0A6A3ZKX4_9STRA|nr:hypothetical protein PF003_g4182 [Phytophthora fragariae]KAE9235852.1 hypothetical protein PF005_g1306 [Phytophthora fragariae]KAE9361395.1 hypothetical protein PF008_g1071 [Phytophthora fragariae]
MIAAAGHDTDSSNSDDSDESDNNGEDDGRGGAGAQPPFRHAPSPSNQREMEARGGIGGDDHGNGTGDDTCSGQNGGGGGGRGGVGGPTPHGGRMQSNRHEAAAGGDGELESMSWLGAQL